MSPELEALLKAAKDALTQLSFTNYNLNKGMSKSIQRMQSAANLDAEKALRKALNDLGAL